MIRAPDRATDPAPRATRVKTINSKTSQIFQFFFKFLDQFLVAYIACSLNYLKIYTVEIGSLIPSQSTIPLIQLSETVSILRLLTLPFFTV